MGDTKFPDILVDRIALLSNTERTLQVRVRPQTGMLLQRTNARLPSLLCISSFDTLLPLVEMFGSSRRNPNTLPLFVNSGVHPSRLTLMVTPFARPQITNGSWVAMIIELTVLACETSLVGARVASKVGT